ncbi:hypothetical protein B0H13DRAFT_2268665 [Mycena leptocephala]|nr:hypothetical protein B0H13DRAFT_2268665 [Mycena leptocephala]
MRAEEVALDIYWGRDTNEKELDWDGRQGYEEEGRWDCTTPRAGRAKAPGSVLSRLRWMKEKEERTIQALFGLRRIALASDAYLYSPRLFRYDLCLVDCKTSRDFCAFAALARGYIDVYASTYSNIPLGLNDHESHALRAQAFWLPPVRIHTRLDVPTAGNSRTRALPHPSARLLSVQAYPSFQTSVSGDAPNTDSVTFVPRFTFAILTFCLVGWRETSCTARKVGWSSVFGCAFHVLLAMSAARNFLVVGARFCGPQHSSIFRANNSHVLGTLVASAFDSTTCCYPGPSSQHLDLKTKSSESQNGASAASLDYSGPHPVKFAPQLKSFTAAYNISFAFAKLFISSRSPRLSNAYSQLRFRCVVAPHDWTLPRCSALCCVAPPVIIIFPALYPPL